MRVRRGHVRQSACWARLCLLAGFVGSLVDSPPRSWWSASPTAFLPAWRPASVYQRSHPGGDLVVPRHRRAGMAQERLAHGLWHGRVPPGPGGRTIPRSTGACLRKRRPGLLAANLLPHPPRRPAADEAGQAPPRRPFATAGGLDAAPSRLRGMAQMVGDAPFRLSTSSSSCGSKRAWASPRHRQGFRPPWAPTPSGRPSSSAFVSVGGSTGRLINETLHRPPWPGAAPWWAWAFSPWWAPSCSCSPAGESTALLDRGVLVAGAAWGAAVSLPYLSPFSGVGHGQHGLQHSVVNTYTTSWRRHGSPVPAFLAERLGSFIPSWSS